MEELLMRTWFDNLCSLARGPLIISAGTAFLSMLACVSARAQEVQEAGGEANLKLPDLSQVYFLGIDGHKILMFGLIFCVGGLLLFCSSAGGASQAVMAWRGLEFA